MSYLIYIYVAKNDNAAANIKNKFLEFFLHRVLIEYIVVMI